MQSYSIWLLFLAITFCNCQISRVGGTTGPCSAVPIPGAPYYNPVSVESSNVGAQSYQSNGPCPSYQNGYVWYTISTPNAGSITLSTCEGTTFDSVISVYTGSCSSLNCLAYNDDTTVCGDTTFSYLTFLPSPNTTYYVAVYGYGASQGDFQLTISQVSDSNNTTGCTLATQVQGPYLPEVTLYGSNVNGTNGFSGCAASPNSYFTWYQIFPVVGIPVEITTCNPGTNFDTFIQVMEGSDCSQLRCGVSNDDDCNEFELGASSVEFLPNATSYFVAVGGYQIRTGNFAVSFLQQNNSNTPCGNAKIIYPGDVVNGTTVGAPVLSYDACYRVTNYPAVWFQLGGLATNIPVTITTCNSGTQFDTLITVYSGVCDNLQCFTYNDDDCDAVNGASTVKFYPTASSYRFVVSGWGGATGNFVVSVTQ